MKQIILITAILFSIFTQKSAAQDSSKLSPSLITLYYTIKDALVAGNGTAAASGASAFIKFANGIDYKVISEGNINILLKDAGKIAETTDLKKQRTYFSNLSNNMVAVAKAVKLSDQTVYVQYCPMQDSYWLSNEKGIKNPYYGSSMLTCGKVSETIQQP